MDKKKNRKELEITLVKGIEDILKKNNATASKKITKTTQEAAKYIAKKFYKAMKPVAVKAKNDGAKKPNNKVVLKAQQKK